ncbi:MAG TPA: phosphotransferase, partial [Thermomicrobiales bacterium]|nr:phosphotransferase [Thermomicrobiales bacterium]
MPPTVSSDEVLSLLATQFTSAIDNLVQLPGGGVARIFAFDTAGGEYVVRFNSAAELDFDNEAAIIDLLAGSGVPIPRMIAHGVIRDLSWAISDRIPGVQLNSLPPDEFAAMTPQVFATLDRIHATDITTTAGYGYFDATLTGRSSSWREHVLSIREDHPGGYNPPWEVTFATTALDRSLVMSLFAEIERLVAFCPEGRWLIHGDYGYDNILVQDGKITAVLDWLSARFGDFLFDVASLDFWSDFDFAVQFHQHYRES